MKYLYLQYLKVRVWMLRRRLRRLGFRDVAENTPPLTLLRLKIEHVERPSQIMRWLEIGLLITGLALWFKCYFRIAEHFETAPPQIKQNARPLPQTVRLHPLPIGIHPKGARHDH
jgi:hypothetical protein